MPWPRGRFTIPGGAGITAVFDLPDDEPVAVSQTYTDEVNRINRTITENPSAYASPSNDALGLPPNQAPEPSTGPTEKAESLKAENAPSCNSAAGNIQSKLTQILSEAAQGKWFETGLKGGQSNPNILGLWKNIGLSAPNDQTPWCMAFVQSVLKSTGHFYVKSGWTGSMPQLKADVITNNISEVPTKGKAGDILLYKREGGGHVTFLYQVGSTIDQCKNCGGNQSAGGAHKDSGGDVTSSKVVTTNFVALYRPKCSE